MRIIQRLRMPGLFVVPARHGLLRSSVSERLHRSERVGEVELHRGAGAPERDAVRLRRRGSRRRWRGGVAVERQRQTGPGDDRSGNRSPLRKWWAVEIPSVVRHHRASRQHHRRGSRGGILTTRPHAILLLYVPARSPGDQYPRTNTGRAKDGKIAAVGQPLAGSVRSCTTQGPRSLSGTLLARENVL